MRQNPCRHCSFALKHKERYYPSVGGECRKCSDRKAHDAYLKSVRKYLSGEAITTLDELMKQTYVIWHERTVHIEAIKSLQYRVIISEIAGRRFYKAIPRECEKVQK